jgi:hypothetical protein
MVDAPNADGQFLAVIADDDVADLGRLCRNPHNLLWIISLEWAKRIRQGSMERGSETGIGCRYRVPFPDN